MKKTNSPKKVTPKVTAINAKGAKVVKAEKALGVKAQHAKRVDAAKRAWITIRANRAAAAKVAA